MHPPLIERFLRAVSVDSTSLVDHPVRILEDDAVAAIGGASGYLIFVPPTLAGKDSLAWPRCPLEHP